MQIIYVNYFTSLACSIKLCMMIVQTFPFHFTLEIKFSSRKIAVNYLFNFRHVCMYVCACMFVPRTFTPCVSSCPFHLLEIVNILCLYERKKHLAVRTEKIGFYVHVNDFPSWLTKKSAVNNMEKTFSCPNLVSQVSHLSPLNFTWLKTYCVVMELPNSRVSL